MLGRLIAAMPLVVEIYGFERFDDLELSLPQNGL